MLRKKVYHHFSYLSTPFTTIYEQIMNKILTDYEQIHFFQIIASTIADIVDTTEIAEVIINGINHFLRSFLSCVQAISSSAFRNSSSAGMAL